jgi:ketosteroid isomerase-like protein
MASDFAMLTAGSHGAPVGRAAWLERVAVPSTLHAFEYDAIRIRVIDDVALVQSRCRESALRDGAIETATFRFTDIWQRSGGRWRISLRHAGL